MLLLFANGNKLVRDEHRDCLGKEQVLPSDSVSQLSPENEVSTVTR